MSRPPRLEIAGGLYHLLAKTRRANLSRFVQRLNTSYALYFRYKHRRPGHVFKGRYRATIQAAAHRPHCRRRSPGLRRRFLLGVKVC